MSVSRVTYDADAQTVQWRIRMFTDDLELALQQRGAEKLRLGLSNEAADADRHLAAYLADRLALRVNGTAHPLSFSKKTVDEEATECYLRAEGIAAIDSLFLENRVLTEVFDEQANLVRVRIGSFQTYLNLDKSIASEQLAL